MKTRLIENGPHLPPSFAVIESSSYAGAVADMKEAFRNQKTRLVVWNKAAALLPDLKHKTDFPATCPREIKKLGVIPVSPINTTSLSDRHRDLFHKFTEETALPRDFMHEWQSASVALIEALYEVSQDGMNSELRLEKMKEARNLHFDRSFEPLLVTLRIVRGDKTHYFDRADISESADIGGIKAKPDATRWVTGDLAVAFHSKWIAHTAPSVQTGGQPDQWRALELHTNKVDFIAIHY